MSNGIISRHCQRYRVHVDDFRLAFGTPEMKKKVLRQKGTRSEAAKAGWAKRRAASVDRSAQRRNRATGSGPKGESAVVSEASETPNLSHRSPTNGENSGTD